MLFFSFVQSGTLYEQGMNMAPTSWSDSMGLGPNFAV